ncbi:putative type VI secretion system effector [Acinetobacter bereziniae]|uniref:putative type VI secretion system effector n=1 Tax=Acinetobacter bereziniae TaxID=106648 RepID=UPI001250BDCE|nr:putative type VI secretion system effector [Acinetobacter bereziniae]
MSLKKTEQIINELSGRMFIVDGEVTDLLTSETMQNLNGNMQTTTGAIAVGSALVGQIGTAALASFAASDEGIEVSDFAIEITDNSNQKHYFRGCFPVVIFKKGDMVKVIAEPLSGQNKYAYASAIIDQKNNYIWTSQEVVKGRIQHRITSMKFGLIIGCFSILVFCLFAFFDDNWISFIFSQPVLASFFICLFISLFIGWRIGASFDEQSIELEAILKKLGFNKPNQMNLQNFALSDLSWKNKEKDFIHERWKDYTYRIDLAKQYDEEKYGKK